VQYIVGQLQCHPPLGQEQGNNAISSPHVIATTQLQSQISASFEILISS
jgi:hypothetical protein